MRIPQSAYFNAIEGNGGVGRDGKTVWDDPGYCADMRRLHPECGVSFEGTVFSFQARAAARPRNRFGIATTRKVYR